MSLAEAIEQSDWRMDEADLNEFTNRVLFDDEQVIAAFSIRHGRGAEQHSIVFTSSRLVLESEHYVTVGSIESRTVLRKGLISIPYDSISVHAVLVDKSRSEPSLRGEAPDPPFRTAMEVLRIWSPGYYDDNRERWIDIQRGDKLNLNLLSKILSQQIAQT